jgi:hypothetical protein
VVGPTHVAQQPDPRVDPEHVEAVVRHGSDWDRLGEVAPCRPGPAPEPVHQRVAERQHVDPIQQWVADPVGLDDAPVERIADSGRPGD